MGLVFYLLISLTFPSSQASANSKDTEKDVDVHVGISFEINLTKIGIYIQNRCPISILNMGRTFAGWTKQELPEVLQETS